MFRLTHGKPYPIAFLALAVALTAGLPTIAAAGPLNRGDVARKVDEALPGLIGSNNGLLVSRMLDARFGSPISANFHERASLVSVFGPHLSRFDPNCRQRTTPTGDPSREECVVEQGSRSGSRAYAEFAWDRDLGFGNVRYLRRPAASALPPDSLRPVVMSDAAAYAKATNFLVRTMGLPPGEFAPTLPGAQLALPVRSLVLGKYDPSGIHTRTPVLKLVKFRRSVEFDLPTPVPGGPGTMRIRAPGEALVALDDSSIWTARINHWVELDRSPLIDPANAKSRDELVDEITEAIMQTDEDAEIADIDAYLVINDPSPEGVGLLLPAVQRVRHAIEPGVEVSIAVRSKDPSEAVQEQAGPSSSGHIHQFSLVRVSEPPTPQDD